VFLGERERERERERGRERVRENTLTQMIHIKREKALGKNFNNELLVLVRSID
jgi:hypothetical protein